MEITIKDKVYTFKFGVKFVRELDKEMPLEREGIKFGLGLQSKVIPELQTGNINTLAKVLYMANKTEAGKLTQSMIDDYIDDCEDIEALFDEVLKALEESNAGKLAMRTFKASV